MEEERLVRTSKFLAKYLRHQPEELGLTLQPGGWVDVEDLLQACASRRFYISREDLDKVVERNSKKRFAFDETGTRIRANQGHSVEVDLQLAPVEPPARLYHGTADRFMVSIQRDGLVRMSRHHVHLSHDIETAVIVGRRHGRPAVFEVDAAAMHRDGHQFYRSANGVWLADAVDPQYLRLMSAAELK